MVRVLFAIQNHHEQEGFRDVLESQELKMSVIVPSNVRDVDDLVTSGEIDIIVTDFQFQNGGFADWLFLWQHPFVILADWQDYERLQTVISSQTSDFVIRDPENRHLHYLPLAIRNVLNNKESMERHNVDLRMNEERFSELVQALPDVVYSLDKDGCITFINNSVRGLGWDPSELVGKHFSVLLDDSELDRVSRARVLPRMYGKQTGSENAPKLFDERRSGDRRTNGLEVKLKSKESASATARTLFGAVIAYGEVNCVAFELVDQPQEEPGTVGIIRDITDRVESDRLLRQSLCEKEILLSEIHHRVKNNMQVISSLLNLHAGGIQDETAMRRFTDAQMQIQSMALIHERLYQSEHFDEVAIDDYTHRLVAHLFDAYQIDNDRIAIETDVDSVPITISQAVPLALLLNELVSNCLKYAFPQGRSGKITITLRCDQEQRVTLCVADNGKGLPDGFSLESMESLGFSLIAGLTSQLEGTLEAGSGPPHEKEESTASAGGEGAWFRVTFVLDATKHLDACTFDEEIDR